MAARRSQTTFLKDPPVRLTAEEETIAREAAAMLAPIFSSATRNGTVEFEAAPKRPRIPAGTPEVHARHLLEKLGPEDTHGAREIIGTTPLAVQLLAMTPSVVTLASFNRQVRPEAMTEICGHATIDAITKAGLKIQEPQPV